MDILSRTPRAVQPRRKSQVFVEIPPSPFVKRVASSTSKVDTHSTSHIHQSRKENALPLSSKTSMANIPRDNKRKAVNDECDVAKPDPKKAKPTCDESTLAACHQCRSKKSSNVVLQCTRVRDGGVRCKAFYCDTCLKNRYGENLEVIKQNGPSDAQQEEEYTFTCPRCEGHCNCAPCRKKKGLSPVGKIVVLEGQGSVKEILEKNPQASGLLPKNSVFPTQSATKTPANSASHTKESRTQVSKPKQSDKPAPVRKVKKKKEVPEPVWVPIPGVGDKKDVEDRIFLREFVIRFNPILEIAIRNVDELENFSALHDQSAKAILVALLDLIGFEDATHKKTIQGTVKAIRGLGLNWGKIMLVLYELRDELPRDHPLSGLPDLEESVMETTYNTRGARMQGVHADQLLPILLFLVELLMEGESVRTELEVGTKQVKETRALYFKAMKEETERWATEKATLMEERPASNEKEKSKSKSDPWRIKYREAETAHKQTVANLQNMHKADLDSCSSRFMPLGRDLEGRVYYALSASGPQKGKKDRVPSESERVSMKKWGWLLACYGKPGSVVKPLDSDDMDSNSDEEGESGDRWWGFSDADEMRKLSKWFLHEIEIKEDTSSGNSKAPSAFSERAQSPRRSLTPLSVLEEELGSKHKEDRMMPRGAVSEVKTLAKSVMEFADFIEWRLKRE
ncbi:hypothetical protein M422DRAFT_27922 [Sphaerobolus stellatus SS14]|nr:hypothetical protein M422DRAFT_27922 [Sphaerobolus stellatus SS14]